MDLLRAMEGQLSPQALHGWVKTMKFDEIHIWEIDTVYDPENHVVSTRRQLFCQKHVRVKVLVSVLHF